ncbi:hypothetical protein Droror1_Dr00020477, partial [Drosera rotundifolia]
MGWVAAARGGNGGEGRAGRFGWEWLGDVVVLRMVGFGEIQGPRLVVSTVAPSVVPLAPLFPSSSSKFFLSSPPTLLTSLPPPFTSPSHLFAAAVDKQPPSALNP